MGVPRLSLEKVQRRLGLNRSKAVGSGIHPCGRAQFLIGQPVRMDGGRLLILIILLPGLGFPPTFQDLARKDPMISTNWRVLWS